MWDDRNMPGGLSLLAGGLNAGRWRRHPRLGLRTEMRRVWTLRGRRPMVDHGNHTRRFGKIYHVGNYEGATRNCLIIATPAQKTAGQKPTPSRRPWTSRRRSLSCAVCRRIPVSRAAASSPSTRKCSHRRANSCARNSPCGISRSPVRKHRWPQRRRSRASERGAAMSGRNLSNFSARGR